MKKKDGSINTFRDIVPVFFGGILLFGLLTAGLVHLQMRADALGGRSVQEETMEELFSGMAGMGDVADELHDYDRNSQMIRVKTPGETSVAGIEQVNRVMTSWNMFRQNADKADELGYEARRVITDNQMPYQEYYTLLQIVEAEATGGDVKSKLLIADVVLNRVEDERFPDTISEVVWQNVDGYPQFSPTADGRMGNLTITESTIQAVRRALEGENIAEGALFFMAPSSANDTSMKWFDDTLVYLYEYGGHAYYRFPYEGEAEAAMTKREEHSTEEVPREETEHE